MKFYKIFFLLTLIFFSLVKAENLSILKKVDIYTTEKDISFSNINKVNFTPLLKDHVNYGFNSKISIWLRLELTNLDDINKYFILEINNPLLEHITLYAENCDDSHSGMLHIKERLKSLNPSFKLNLFKKEKKVYYLKLSNSTTALQFSILLKGLEEFKKNDLIKQFLIVFFIGVILAFIIYSFSLFIYTKEKSYLYYCIYIFTLLFQQLTYIGFLPLYAPSWFTYYDNLIVVPKVGMMIITAIIFARSFLKSKYFPKLDRIYKFLIYFVSLQILLLSTPYFYYPEVTILTALFFIFFNLFSAVYIYRSGNKQARFFIVGWSFLSIGYFLTIIDALGIISVMYFLPPLILILTLIEALFLLLAFIDRLNILQIQKELLDKKLYEELKERNILIRKEVKKQTKNLENLYRELHHRVKNNLQLMLSIIRLQGQSQNTQLQEQFVKLENRIKSISQTHDLLYLNDEIEKINMYKYLYKLYKDIDSSLNNRDISFELKTDVKMPLKKAIYVGIIINELISNTIKYAITCSKININLEEKKGKYFLYVYDDGNGFKIENISTDSLGLSLVKNLVIDQLAGEIEINSLNKCEYIIRF